MSSYFSGLAPLSLLSNDVHGSNTATGHTAAQASTAHGIVSIEPIPVSQLTDRVQIVDHTAILPNDVHVLVYPKTSDGSYHAGIVNLAIEWAVFNEDHLLDRAVEGIRFTCFVLCIVLGNGGSQRFRVNPHHLSQSLNRIGLEQIAISVFLLHNLQRSAKGIFLDIRGEDAVSLSVGLSVHNLVEMRIMLIGGADLCLN